MKELTQETFKEVFDSWYVTPYRNGEHASNDLYRLLTEAEDRKGVGKAGGFTREWLEAVVSNTRLLDGQTIDAILMRHTQALGAKEAEVAQLREEVEVLRLRYERRL